METNYVSLALGWILYCVLHSLLASEAIKSRIKNTLPLLHKRYRIIYNLFAATGLFAMLVLNGAMVSPYLLQPVGVVRLMSFITTAFGVLIVRQSFKSYSLREFLLGDESGASEFRQGGILKYVRHPIYSGTILILVGFWLFKPDTSTLISVGVLLGYLPIGIMLEERKLVKEFGDKYLAYKRNVPMLIPRLRPLFS